MKVAVLGAFGGNVGPYRLTSFLINEFLAIDAGCLTSALDYRRQMQISDVVISHSHSDHTGTLPFLIDNQFGVAQKPLRVWGSRPVIQAIRQHIFNDVIWPDFSRLPNDREPCLVFHEIESEVSFNVRGLKITPVAVNHIVPCQGFFVEPEEGGSCLLYTSDTSNTDRVWELANQRDNLKAVIVDCSFPNRLEKLAKDSGHMTPRLLAEDLKKLKKPCEILIYHLKPSFESVMCEELDALGYDNLLYEIQDRTFQI